MQRVKRLPKVKELKTSSKGKRIKTLAKGDKPATTKSKGLTVLFEVALSEAAQIKLATKRSLKEFHISHASGSGDGVDILSKVPDEQQQTGSGTNEGAGDKPDVPDVPEYKSESEEESWTFSQGEEEDEDDDEHNNEEEDEEHDNDKGDDFVHLNLSTYIADDQEKEKEEEKVDDDDDDDDVTSDQKVSTPPDYELTEEDENQEDDDTMGEDQEDKENGELYGDLNLNLDRQDAEMTDALSSIPGIVDKYLETKVKDTVDVAIQLKSDKLREEVQAENQDFLNSLDSNKKRIIKEQVKAQTSKIMTKVEKYVTETLGVEVLVRISQKSKENSQKQVSTDTRIRRVQKEAKDSKSKLEKSSPQSNPKKIKSWSTVVITRRLNLKVTKWS
ncbi:hypothetical protein Tco_1506234 [Tanacetum coccineum]